MSYLGKVKPTVALTSDDITDGAVVEAKIGGNAVTSAKINDGAIVNADLNTSAAIAKTKLASLDVVDADVNASAAIALSKLATDPSNASNLSSGTVPTARLGSGTADATTFLRGDQTYAAVTSGLTAASQWRTNANQSISSSTETTISGNWEEADTGGYGRIGSAFTESSGIFTFPSTGYWFITWAPTGYAGGNEPYFMALIHTTTDNSTYSLAARAYGNWYAGARWSTPVAQFLFDVTSTTNCKVKFRTFGDGGQTIEGNTSANNTTATFLKLGDT